MGNDERLSAVADELGLLLDELRSLAANRSAGVHRKGVSSADILPLWPRRYDRILQRFLRGANMELTSELEALQSQLAQVDLLTTPSRSSRAGDISFLLLKRGHLKFKMYQESGHSLPHIHIDYGRRNHAASYRIDPPSRIIGSLDRKYDLSVTEWISSRKDKLLETWAVVQSGGDPASLARELAGDA